MGLERIDIISDETRKKFLIKDIDPQRAIEALGKLEVFPREAVFVLTPTNLSGGIKDFIVFDWDAKKANFQLSEFSQKQGLTLADLRGRSQEFRITETDRQRGEGFRAFFNAELPLLKGWYALSSATLEFEGGKLSDKKNASIRFSIFPYDQLRVEVGNKARVKGQLESWFASIAVPTR